jgi:hypothetical protein
MDGTKRFNVIEWRSFSRSGSSRGDLRAAPGKIVCAKRRIRLNTAYRNGEHWPLAQSLLVALDLAHRSGRGGEVLNAWTGPSGQAVRAMCASLLSWGMFTSMCGVRHRLRGAARPHRTPVCACYAWAADARDTGCRRSSTNITIGSQSHRLPICSPHVPNTVAPAI